MPETPQIHHQEDKKRPLSGIKFIINTKRDTRSCKVIKINKRDIRRLTSGSRPPD